MAGFLLRFFVGAIVTLQCGIVELIVTKLLTLVKSYDIIEPHCLYLKGAKEDG
jgi:hypothetical protein